MPPAVWHELFAKYDGKIYGRSDFFTLITKKHGDSTKITTREHPGNLPYEFMSKQFNKGLPFDTKCVDQAIRDVKKFYITYTLPPMSNCTIYVTMWWKLPGTRHFQSIE